MSDHVRGDNDGAVRRQLRATTHVNEELASVLERPERPIIYPAGGKSAPDGRENGRKANALDERGTEGGRHGTIWKGGWLSRLGRRQAWASRHGPRCPPRTPQLLHVGTHPTSTHALRDQKHAIGLAQIICISGHLERERRNRSGRYPRPLCARCSTSTARLATIAACWPH